MSYATELDAISRTPQVLVTVAMTSCDNHYASGTVIQQIDSSENLEQWNASGGTTVSFDQYPLPEGAVLNQSIIDKVAFAAVSDYLETDDSDANAASTAFNGSLWLRTDSGTGTITLQLISTAAAVETFSKVCSLTTTPRRFSVSGTFTGAAGGKVRLRILRDTGNLAVVGAWGGQVSIGLPLYSFLSQPGVGPGPNVSHCQAADAGNGSRCWYSSSTCQDPTNFKINQNGPYAGLKLFRFCLKDSPLALAGGDVWPMLKSVDFVPQEIDPERSVTVSERVKLVFHDDAATWAWNQDKAGDGALTNTTTPSGTFWRRFMAIYRNYSNPRNWVKVSVGFVEAGATVSDYQQRGQYLVDNMEIDNRGTVTMELISALRLLRTKAPAKISESNLLNGAINNSVTTAVFDDLSELTPPGGGYTVTIQIADDTGWTSNSEFLNVTANLGGNAATVQRGRWGSTAVSHGDNSVWREILMFGTERSTPSLTPLGKNPIDIAIELLRRGGIPFTNIDLTTLQDERDTWLQSSVDTATGAQSGVLFKRAGTLIDTRDGGISIQQDIEKLLMQIRQATMLSLGVGEDNIITGRIFAPTRPSVTLLDLTETSHLVKNSVSVDDNEKSRLTRVILARDLRADREGTGIEDYQTFSVVVGADEESAKNYGVEPRTLVILSPWIRAGDTTTAQRLARRIFRRFSNPARKIGFSLEIKDDALQAMDFAFLTTSKIVKPDGTTETQRIVEVIKKKREAPGRLSFIGLDTALFGRYAFIAPAATPDYDSATPQQRRYGFIGTATDNLVGTLKDYGYRIWG